MNRQQKNRAKKIRSRLSLRWICIITAVLLIFLSSAVSSAISLIFNHVFRRPLNLPASLSWLILGVVLGTAAWLLLEFIFTRPIKELDKAMKDVAKGNFGVKLTPRRRVREIRDLYDNFNIMTDELASTEILQTDFVSNVSHEFKTPINAIEGYATLLQTNADAEDRQRYTEKILVNTGRLSELVSNILLLSKLDNQSVALPTETYRLDEQIRMALLLLEPKWTEKSIGFDVDMQPVSYVGNAPMLQHVWLNLIDNAVKFSPAGGTVTIRLTQQGDGIVFTIENPCAQISTQDMRHIFDKFYQCDPSHKADGNGLGLALVHKILSVSGGTVRADNTADGCRFTVTLQVH